MDDTLLTIQDIHDLSSINVRTLQLRASREAWPCIETKGKGRGGVVKRYKADLLPDDIRYLYYKGQLDPVPAGECRLPAMPETSGQIREQQKAKALAKADLLRLYTDAVKSSGWGNKAKARKNFMRAYNSGMAWPLLYEIIGKVSWKTIEGWKRALETTGDAFELADNRGYWRKGQRIVTDEQAEIVLRCVLHPNKPLIAEAIRMSKAVMHARGIDNGHSESTYRRWIEDWRKENFDIWTFAREGAKAFNEKCAMSIVRDYNLINVGDILVADGHILNFEIINPWTGKPKRMVLILWYDMKSSYPMGWEIMPTENTQAIASALRRAIMRLGMFPKVAYLDNGKAFGARFFNGVNLEESGIGGLFDRAGIRTIFAWPYHGQSKTVERFFGTFGELERWCPTYVGNSIANKPPRLNRGEFLHRKAYDKVMGDNCLTMEQAHRAIASWFDVYVQRPQRGHLNGACPLEVFEEGRGAGVDADELRYLMMSLEIKHIRSTGIRIFNRDYYHPELHGRRHSVIVRYDLQDTSAIYVSDTDDNFLCMATEPEGVHPAATVLGTDDDKKRLARHIAEKKRQEKFASVTVRAFLEEEVLPEHRRMLKSMGVSESGPVDSAPKRIESSKPIGETEKKRIEAQVTEFYREKADLAAEFFGQLEKMSEMDRYERLVEADVRGMLIPQQWQAFMRYFEQTPAYQRDADYYDAHRAKMAMMWQVKEPEGVKQKV